ncbi:processed acidic surface protein [Oceanobacillus bengalensis]|uniref:Processed acidic surface protein n=1 Tax=Oceanobacillus bengalensis TaxID=1435466 RepID=A0A494YZD0_9BACI|nr:processed acidic surface protein [Oceanobacillus bengalensis]RKQ15518.1 processed acidic surface protein [Oceanobacillus bengalensis]
MKRIVSLLLALIISIGVLPTIVLAIEENDPAFESYIEEIGWEKQDYIDYLESKEWSLEDHFISVDELGIPLTEESIKPVLEDFDLTREELNALLVEFGDIAEGQDVLDGEYLVFEEDLSYTVDYYVNGLTPVDDNSLQELLDYYEFDSKEALESFLNEYDESIEYYDYIEDLEMTVDMYLYPAGTVIDDDNLQELLENYDFGSKEDLELYLKEYGDSIEYYAFIEDLDYSIDMYQNGYYEEDDLTYLDEELIDMNFVDTSSVYIMFLLQLFYGLISS